MKKISLKYFIIGWKNDSVFIIFVLEWEWFKCIWNTEFRLIMYLICWPHYKDNWFTALIMEWIKSPSQSSYFYCLLGRRKFSLHDAMISIRWTFRWFGSNICWLHFVTLPSLCVRRKGSYWCRDTEGPDRQTHLK